MGVGASSNPYQVMNGKKTILLSAFGAAIICDAEGTIEDGVLVLRVDSRPREARGAS